MKIATIETNNAYIMNWELNSESNNTVMTKILLYGYSATSDGEYLWLPTY